MGQKQHWTITEKVLSLVFECFETINSREIDLELYDLSVDTILGLKITEHTLTLAENTLVVIAKTAPEDVRNRVVEYLKNEEQTLERLQQQAFLGVSLPDGLIKSQIEKILRGINPKPVVSKDGHTTFMGIGGANPRAILSFNKVLSPDLYDLVIEGLLEAIINDHSELYIRADAIFTLARLPEGVLVKRAKDVIDYLIWGAEGTLPQSDMIKMELESQTNPFSAFRINFGNVEQVRRDSLYSMGKLFQYVDVEKQKEIEEQIIIASRDRNPVVRQGAAMALSTVSGSRMLQSRTVMALMVLLHDTDPKPCSWACQAVGHLISLGLVIPFEYDLIERLVNLAGSLSKDIRVGVAIGLRKILQTEGHVLDDNVYQQCNETLVYLSGDISFQVRRRTSIL